VSVNERRNECRGHPEPHARTDDSFRDPEVGLHAHAYNGIRAPEPLGARDRIGDEALARSGRLTAGSELLLAPDSERDGDCE
jgi:hypothetical protein